jgi:hypothetical protein
MARALAGWLASSGEKYLFSIRVLERSTYIFFRVPERSTCTADESQVRRPFLCGLEAGEKFGTVCLLCGFEPCEKSSIFSRIKLLF